MAALSVAYLGKEKFKCAILRNTYDLANIGASNFPSATDPFAYCARTGTDISEYLYEMEQGDERKLFTFSDGSYCVLIHEGSYISSIDNIKRYTVCVGMRTSGGSFISNEFAHGNAIIDYNGRHYPMYMFAYIDNERKTARFSVCAQTGSNTCSLAGGVYAVESRYYNWFTKDSELYDPDPWSNAGYGETGGGDGTFDFTSDAIALPEIPTLNAISTGFLQLYKATISEIRQLAGYMWTDSFISGIVKLTADPMDIILSLYMYPFFIPATERKLVQAGNVVTNVSMGVPDSQTIDIDCGNFSVPSFYGSYLDFEPFSKCELYLPYCGMQTISLDDIVGKTVNVRYRVDLLTGSCAAFVLVEGNVMYTFAGVCAVSIPITSRGFENTINAVFNTVSAGVAAFTGVGSAAMVATFGASAASNVMQSKPNIARSGNVAGNVGYLGVQKPYFVFTVPRVAIPKGLSGFTGYPIYNTYKLSDLKGYTEIEEIHLENMGRATATEIDMIEKLLKEGVIL